MQFRRGADVYPALSWGAVALATLIYLIHYLGARSLWLDEAMAALNIKYLWLDELTGKLEYQQIAPIGWLFLQKLAYAFSHNLEFGLRFTSLLAGIGSVVLFRNLSFRALDGFGAFVATLLFAVSPSLARYAVEAKPYIFDVLFAVASLAAALAVMAREKPSRRDLTVLGAVGVGTVVFSFAAVYVLAAAAGAAILKHFFRGDRRTAYVLAAMAAGWLVLFAGMALGVYAPQLAGSDLTEGGSQAFFSRTSFAPLPPTSIDDVKWYADWVHRMISFLFGDGTRFITLLLLAIGGIGLLTRSIWLTIAAFGPVALGLVASHFHVYPLYDRLLLFMLPGLILAIGGGLDWLVARGKGSVRAPAIVVALFLLTSLPFLLVNLFAKPPFAHQDVRPILATLDHRASPGDLIYVANPATPSYLLYRDEFHTLKRRPWLAGKAVDQHWDCLLQDLDGRPAFRRAWFVLIGSNDIPPDMDALPPLLAARALHGQARIEAAAAKAWLVRLELDPAGSGRVGAVPPKACGRDDGRQKFDPPARLIARHSRASRPG